MTALLPFAQNVRSQQLVIGSGSTLSLGDGVLDAGCRNVDVQGTLQIGAGVLRGVRDVGVDGTVQGGSGTLALSGDLDAAAGLLPQQGIVRIENGCSSVLTRVTGNHAFHDLRVETATAHTLVLPAGGTQSIANALVLRGDTDRLTLRSSSAGTLGEIVLAPGASQSIHRLDIMDVGATAAGQYLAPLAPAIYDSIDRGNSPRFFGALGLESVVQVPMLSPAMLAALALLAGGLAMSRLRSRSRANR